MPPASPKDNYASLRKRLPGLGEAQYARLDAWYGRYAALLLRVHERLASDPEAHARFRALTSEPHRPTMNEKVDSPKQHKQPEL